MGHFRPAGCDHRHSARKSCGVRYGASSGEYRGRQGGWTREALARERQQPASCRSRRSPGACARALQGVAGTNRDECVPQESVLGGGQRRPHLEQGLLDQCSRPRDAGPDRAEVKEKWGALRPVPVSARSGLCACGKRIEPCRSRGGSSLGSVAETLAIAVRNSSLVRAASRPSAALPTIHPQAARQACARP